jgi:DNA-binding transcriptional ArsR family regulator
MNSIIIERRVRDVMPASSRPHVEVRAGAAFELLIGLSALTSADGPPAGDRAWLPERLSRSLGRAIERVGAKAGEVWLHLLGLALELPALLDAGAFVAEVGAVEADELRRHVVGVYVPAWRELVGAETLERAAAGDGRAAAELLGHERYYGGRARESLSHLLPLTAAQTKQRLVVALGRFADDVFRPLEPEIVGVLAEDARAKRALAASLGPEALISAATAGYVYEPEPEFGRVVLVPHRAAAPWLLLCQHRDARIICYAVEPTGKEGEADVGPRALRLGRALADERRIRILRRLVAGEATLAELADALGLAKSTAHHHLAQLRAAGLVTLRGNARGYWYSLRGEGLGEARSLLGELLVP